MRCLSIVPSLKPPLSLHLHLGAIRKKAVLLVELEDLARFFRGRNHAVRILDGEGHRFLTKHVLSGAGGRNGRAGRISVDDQLVHGRSSAEREAAVHDTKLRLPIRSIPLAGMETSLPLAEATPAASRARSRATMART